MSVQRLYRWTVHGSHVCDRCKALDGQIRPMEAWFSVGPFHPHCHCTIDLVLSELLGTLPVIYLTMADFPILLYQNQFNPPGTQGPKELLTYPICPYMPDDSTIVGNPLDRIPVADLPQMETIQAANTISAMAAASVGKATIKATAAATTGSKKYSLDPNSDDYAPEKQAGHPGQKNKAIAI